MIEEIKKATIKASVKKYFDKLSAGETIDEELENMFRTEVKIFAREVKRNYSKFWGVRGDFYENTGATPLFDKLAKDACPNDNCSENP